MTEQKTPKKVLIIDDNESLRTILGDKLIASGFETLGATDGEDGLKQALELHPDIILLDVLMPKMNGWEMLEKLRQDAWGKSANVIMLTSLESTENIAHAMEKGSYQYFLKTDCDLNEVVNQIKTKYS
jgi:DNA-binding response OmpR family regulator